MKEEPIKIETSVTQAKLIVTESSLSQKTKYQESYREPARY
jgi:hypothetical protein